MIRRSFLKLLCGLPGVAVLKPIPAEPAIDDDYLELYFKLLEPPDRWKPRPGHRRIRWAEYKVIHIARKLKT